MAESVAENLRIFFSYCRKTCAYGLFNLTFHRFLCCWCYLEKHVSMFHETFEKCAFISRFLPEEHIGRKFDKILQPQIWLLSIKSDFRIKNLLYVHTVPGPYFGHLVLIIVQILNLTFF